MALQIDTIAHACQLITREIREHQKNLTVHFIVHHEGQRTEALALAGQQILSHPAAETAMHFLQKPRRSEDSAYLGTAVARQKLLFGLATRDTVLSLCTINAEQFSSLKEVRRQAYHLAWHALDSVEYHKNPQNRTGEAREVIVRKRNGLELAGANLRADIFGAAMSTFHGDRDAVKRTAMTRGTAALSTRSLYSPEFYPFIIATEAAEFALKRIDEKLISKKSAVPMSLKIAREVGKTFDEINLKHWLAFAEPAQDMAWRGYAGAEIVSAAINTSPNTYVRAIGYLISELASITPAPVTEIRENYSPFADDVFNAKLHEKIVEQIFQDVIAQGLKQNSAVPFLNMANQQNHALTEGRTMGWCASALHAAGVAYDTGDNSEAEIRARQEFASKKGDAKWADLKALGKRVTREQRQGNLVTMSDLKELSRDIEDLKALRQSVQKTLEDPHFKEQLAAANELTAAPAVKPVMPAPSAAPKAAPAAPAPGHGFSIPGLGGRSKVARTAAVQQKKAEKDATGKQQDEDAQQQAGQQE